jgi:hypothetical protein
MSSIGTKDFQITLKIGFKRRSVVLIGIAYIVYQG